jgi:hypothetical protein
MRKSLDHLNGIRDSRFRYSCAICRNGKGLLEYAKVRKDITITTCCDSLTCVECAEKGGVHRCSVCLKETRIGFQPKSWLGLGGMPWNRRYPFYEEFTLMEQRMPFLVPFIARIHNGDWKRVVEIEEDGDQSQKSLLLKQYVSFEKDFLQKKALFCIFQTLNCLPFKRTPEILDFFDVVRCAPNSISRISRKFLLKRFQTGFMRKLSHNFFLDENRTLFRTHFFLMIFKRVLTKRLRW